MSHHEVVSPSRSPSLHSAQYEGLGTITDPFVVDWHDRDPENPTEWSRFKRWMLTLQLGLATWNVSFASSSYSGGLGRMITQLDTNRTVADLGISLYVLGFGLGPLCFAPLSEIYGRRIVFLCTYTPYLLFHLGGALAKNIQTVIICRFLAGVAGSAPITNSGGQVSDMWPPRERTLATAIYSLCTFFGPVSGPIVGGFVSQSFHSGWRVNFWIMFGLSTLVIILAFFYLEESYPPVLLRRRAKRLQEEAGGTKYFVSIYDHLKPISKRDFIILNMKRPFIFLFTEPIIFLVALYVGVAYATLYAQFVAYPIVFGQHRHFSPGDTGLAFLGIAVGQWIAVASSPLQSQIYASEMTKRGGILFPEARLYSAMVGGIALPVGMFWFAWTTFPSVHPIIPILAGIPFGFGTILIMTTLNAYLMDAYSLYCASALAATVLLRSVFASVFPLFSTPMFSKLGDQWASSVFAFVALLCMPIPFLFFKYGVWIRSKSRYALHTEGDKGGERQTIRDLKRKEKAKV